MVEIVQEIHQVIPPRFPPGSGPEDLSIRSSDYSNVHVKDRRIHIVIDVGTQNSFKVLLFHVG